jgi:ribosomal protein S18 acetylase RimI-like enzyme
MSDDLQIKIAQPEDFEKISEVFDLYRQFYKKESDVDACKKYILERLKNEEARIFYIENEKECIGMTQLYITFDSLELGKKIVLYDLFVRSEHRKKGIGRLLMRAVKEYAKENNITGIELSTAITNKNAQALYESLHYERDLEYYNYYLPQDKF